MSNNTDEINLCKACQTMKPLNPEGYCGRCGGDGELRDKELETVMERACSNLADGMFADLDNKTVNWPLLFNEVRKYVQTQTVKAALEAQEDLATNIMLEPTEGLFDGGDLFIKRSPIEQVIINAVGYEKFKALQEAANQKEKDRVSALQSQQEKTND